VVIGDCFRCCTVRPLTRRESAGFPCLSRSAGFDVARTEKAARFPGRPFLSYGSCTLAGDFRNLARGLSPPHPDRQRCISGSRDLLPEPARWSPSPQDGALKRITPGAHQAVKSVPLFP